MAHYRTNSPISGFSGHIPGEKWRVGTRIGATTEEEHTFASQNLGKPELSEDTTISSDGSHTYDWEGNPILRVEPKSVSEPHGNHAANQTPHFIHSENGYEQQQRSERSTPLYESNSSTPKPTSDSRAQSNMSYSKTPHPDMYEGYPPQHASPVEDHVNREKPRAESHSRQVESSASEFYPEPDSRHLSQDIEEDMQDMHLESGQTNNESRQTRSVNHSQHSSPAPNQTPVPNHHQHHPNNHQHSDERQHQNGSQHIHQENSRSTSQQITRKEDARKPTDFEPFSDLNSGWWSEGQALKNLHAHQQSLRAKKQDASPNGSTYGEGNNAGEDYRNHGSRNGFSPASYMDIKPRINEQRGVPVPGYSGHMTEMFRLGVGKPFTEAAKESIKLQKSYQESLHNTFIDNDSKSPAFRDNYSDSGARTPY
uniref:Uncharacterized protein n=1 Tax=Ditylenchus dipsaci TaxID=166011 RepID=A0A915CNB1_9BILA